MNDSTVYAVLVPGVESLDWDVPPLYVRGDKKVILRIIDYVGGIQTWSPLDQSQQPDFDLNKAGHALAFIAAMLTMGGTFKQYTAFCREWGGDGTIWIDTVTANGPEGAVRAARVRCAHDWGGEKWGGEPVPLCIGLVAGRAKVLGWVDDDDEGL